VRALPRPHLIVAAAAAVAMAVAAVVLIGAGGDRPQRPAAVRPALIGGAPLQRARCAQWRTGTPAQQRAIVRALAASVGGPSGSARGTTLREPDALALFDNACASSVARHFLLYEIYIRAAGFSSLRAPAQ
jgi:hypothetical protein